MYPQAIALSIRRLRPGCEVKVAPPETTEGELASFRPHLLVHNDGVGLEAVAGIRCRVEVQYGDGMGAEISVDGEVFE